MAAKFWNHCQSLWSSVPPHLWYVWAALTLVTVALLVLNATDWGRRRPLLHYVGFSLIAHLLLAWFALSYTLLGAPGPLGGEQSALRVTSVQAVDLSPPGTPDDEDQSTAKPWQAAPAPTVEMTTAPEPQRGRVDFSAPLEREPIRSELPERLGPAEIQRPSPDGADNVRATQPRPDDDARPLNVADRNLTHQARQQIHPPQADEPAPNDALPNPSNALPSASSGIPPRMTTDELRHMVIERDVMERDWPEPAPSSIAELARPAASPVEPTAARPVHELPKSYERRVVADRQTVVEQQGGSPDTEAAVKAALAWLAANQEADGHWDAAKHGADLDRTHTGGNAAGSMRPDTGVTGLALLAFLGSGHTHQAGDYRVNVQRGVDYLLRMQSADDGNLSGRAATYAAMYCHGMATLALAEVYGMTGDAKLLSPLRQAVGYSLAAQNRRHGGWRYRPGDAWGDTSQFGWQVMALRAAEMAGLTIPAENRQGMQRYLKHVSSGRHGGLAGYLCIVQDGRVQPADAATPTMTAEALFCRMLLGGSADSAECQEAAAYLLQNLPGGGRTDFYYWYYGTMATYQVQGRAWEVWNQHTQKLILTSQDRDGSWSPNDRWGGHGGRVFTTALATLSLEVYYRYVPASQPARAARLRGAVER